MERPTVVYWDGKDSEGCDQFAILKSYNKPVSRFSLIGIEDGLFCIKIDPHDAESPNWIAGCFEEGSNFRRDMSYRLALSRFDNPPQGIKVKRGFREVRILAKDKPDSTKIRSMLRTHSKKPRR
jgi:hypothetical protein